MGVKCKINMSAKVLPQDGSVVGREGEETGTCPECMTPGVMLSVVGGFVRAHEVASVAVPQNNPSPPRFEPKGKKVGKGLSEPQTSLTDTGVRTGDPRSAERRRLAEVETVTGTGMVKVPRKVDSGKTLKSGAPRMVTKLVEVPATEEHVREALAYWQGKRVKVGKDGSVASPSARQYKLDMIEEMFRRLKAFADAPAMVVEGQARDTAAAHRGPTLVRGRAMEADTLTERALTAAREGRGDKPVQPSCDGPLGRERADKRIITVPEPPRKRTPSERRRYRRMLKAGTGRRA